MNLKSLPKISLHDHLDGGLRPQTIADLAEGIDLPSRDAKALGRWFVDSADSGSLVEYLKTFDITTAVMQSAENLRRVAHEFVLDLAEDGVIYGEVRWAPEQHLRGGLTLDEAVDAVQDGLESGAAAVAKTGRQIRTGQIICAMRHTGRSLEIAKLAVAHRENGVVGFDIAGPEAGFPPAQHKAAFDYLASELMPVTVHAGEADGIASIHDALVSGRALRIGHGARLIEDMGSFDSDGDTFFVKLGPVSEWVLDRGIALELCVSSNLQTGLLETIDLPNEAQWHPFSTLYDLGFNVTVSPDNRLMSNTSVTRELELLVDTFDYTLEDIQQFQLNAAEATFQAADDRDELVEQILNGFAKFKK